MSVASCALLERTAWHATVRSGALLRAATDLVTAAATLAACFVRSPIGRNAVHWAIVFVAIALLA